MADENSIVGLFAQNAASYATPGSSQHTSTQQIHGLVLNIFRNSRSDRFLNWGEYSRELDPETMERLYKHYGPSARDTINTGGDIVPTRTFDIRMKDHGDGNYTFAMYFEGHEAGSAKTRGFEMTPDEIFAANPLTPPAPGTAPGGPGF